MKIFGWIVFAFGFSALVFGCSMDTTVSSGDSRVYNLGLLRAQENSIMIGGLALIIGILMVLFGGRSSNSALIDHSRGYQDAEREQITSRDTDSNSRVRRFAKIADAERTLDNDAYKVYLVEKHKIKINEVLKKYFVDGKLYDAVDLALARAHELEMNTIGEPAETAKDKAVELLGKEGFRARSVGCGWRVVGDGVAFDFENDDDLIAYAKIVNGNK